MNLASKNILLYQNVVREKLIPFFSANGYELDLDEWDREASLAMMCRWANHENQDSFELSWDVREHWFHLRYFNEKATPPHSMGEKLIIQPVQVLKVVARRAYASRIANRILESIKGKLNTLNG